MPESPLAGQLADERARAIRVLLGRPMLEMSTPDDFRLVARNRDALTEWFDTTCGWQLTVDVPRGFARLSKRSTHPDATRGARRVRGTGQPFDRRRYELLCLICAELANRTLTTIGLLADNLAALDTARQRERAAFVDALKLLAAWGVLAFESGDPDAYISDERANAFVHADTSRLHRMLSSATPPSRIAASTTADAVEALAAEPRYARDDDMRRVRHGLARRLLDDPAVHLDELTDAERDYVRNPSGRRWLRERVAEGGFELEERAEGFVAVDPDELSTDVVFPGSGGTVKQMALLLIDRFVTEARLRERTRNDLTRHVDALLDAHPGWAKEYRAADGAARLARAAVDLLASLRLVRIDGDVVRPRPAIARYAVASDPQGTLVEV